MIKVYYPDVFFDQSSKNDWFELLRTREKYNENKNILGKELMERLDWVASPEIADIILVPMDWGYYYRNHNAEKFFIWLKSWEGKKPILSQSGGDFGVTIPIDKIWQIRQNIYASKKTPYQIAASVYISDPLPAFFSTSEIILSPYNEIPVIGFCGQSLDSPIIRIKEILRVLYRNINVSLGLRYWDKGEVLSSSNLREDILNIIEDSELQTNFIKRKKYRAGANTPEERRKTTLEYYNNQLASDYTVCVRGGGNFSVRFYETLAVGRIPIFVNTDCVLPFPDDIDWKQHVVWVEKDEIKDIPEMVMSFHRNLGSEGFRSLQIRNRELWLEKLQGHKYFEHLLNKIIDTPFIS